MDEAAQQARVDGYWRKLGWLSLIFAVLSLVGLVSLLALWPAETLPARNIPVVGFIAWLGLNFVAVPHVAMAAWLVVLFWSLRVHSRLADGKDVRRAARRIAWGGALLLGCRLLTMLLLAIAQPFALIEGSFHVRWAAFVLLAPDVLMALPIFGVAFGALSPRLAVRLRGRLAGCPRCFYPSSDREGRCVECGSLFRPAGVTAVVGDAVSSRAAE